MLDQAYQLFGAGKLDAAAKACQAVLSREPANAEANHLLGVICFQQGDTAVARELLARAASSPAASPEMHNNYGGVLDALGDSEGAVEAFNRALAMRPNYPDALNNLGVALRDLKRQEEAIDAFRRAVALRPDFAHAKMNLRAAYRDVVPAWHFAMMDDDIRNSAYEAAIGRAVKGKRVLDIGTGAGLLAMMAARAGAAKVTTCEAVGLIADRARDIVARNGLSDRVTVIGKRSQDLSLGRELSERAQVLITETFASGLISEGILPLIEHAQENLLAEDAVVIPAAASAMGYVAGGEALKGLLFVDKIKGFDLAPFNDFAPPSMGVLLDRFPHDVLSDDVELIRFNFKGKRFPMESRTVAMPVTKPGEAIGIVQWIKLELDQETSYDNRPSPDAPFNGHWTQILYRFPRPLRVNAGDVIPLTVKHNRNQLSVDLIE
jgi:type II protein arginine methyltransferase